MRTLHLIRLRRKAYQIGSDIMIVSKLAILLRRTPRIALHVRQQIQSSIWSWGFALISLFFVPALAAAYTYDTSNLPYTDAPQYRPTAVAVSVLTGEGIVEGNPDGTFGHQNLLNRAEYVKIVMGLVADDGRQVSLSCFPDVTGGVWYEGPVCRAKAWEIVRGNAIEGVPEDQWSFAPERNVQYEEAIKVLVKIFDLPVPDVAGEWYEPFLQAARLAEVDLPWRSPGDKITRGEMARLVVAFMAFSEGELGELRAAEADEAYVPPAEGEEEPSFAPSPSAEATGNRDGATEDKEEEPTPPTLPPSSAPVVTDPDSNDSTSEGFILLGSPSPVLAAARVMPEAEPLLVEDIIITLQSAVSSIDMFRVYDHDGILIGNAHLAPEVNNKTYKLRMSSGEITIEQGEDFSFYVRAIGKHEDAGGVSGENVEVDTLTVEGEGGWSNNEYSQATTESFSTFETSRSRFVSIDGLGPESDALITGPDRLLGKFSFKGELGDGDASLNITDIVFDIGQSGGVSLANVELSTEDTSDRFGCTAAAITITCSSIPEDFGAVDNDTRILQLFGDITTTDLSKAFLRITINEGGTVASAGNITWYDGTTSFDWVQFDTPVARGTYHSYGY